MLNAYDLKKVFYGLGSGLRQNLDWGDFKYLSCPVPPLSEQAAIARFLDHADRRIQRYIRAKKKLIALLNEQKQAIIHRAVTRGLDPNVRLKPSGVEWLGDIPVNYERTKLGRLCTSIRDGTHNPPPAIAGEHRLLSVRNIQAGRFTTREDDRTMSAAAFDALQRSYTVEAGDVVLALVGATTGKSAVVEKMDRVTVQRSVGILRPRKELLDSHYLHYVISSSVVQKQIRQVMDKYAAQPGIYLNDVGSLQVIFPSLSTQRDVVTLIRHRTHRLDLLLAEHLRQISLCNEYRTRLIADIVTGKLDVREAAVKLPDDDLAAEPVDDLDSLDETDEEVEDVDLEAEALPA